MYTYKARYISSKDKKQFLKEQFIFEVRDIINCIDKWVFTKWFAFQYVSLPEIPFLRPEM